MTSASDETEKCAAVLIEIADMQETAAGTLMASHKGWERALRFSAETLRWAAELLRSGDIEPGAAARQCERDKAEVDPAKVTAWLDECRMWAKLEKAKEPGDERE